MAITNDLIPDFDDFERYYSGQMPAEEQRALEGRMLDEPFVAEAYEGFLAWRATHSDAGGMHADLRERLHERVAREKKSALPLWAYASAASVLLALFAYWTFFLRNNQVVTPKNTPTASHNETAKKAAKPAQANDTFASAPKPAAVQPLKAPSIAHTKPTGSATRTEPAAGESAQQPENSLKRRAFAPDAIAEVEVQRDQIVVPQTDAGLAPPAPAQPAPAHALTTPGALQAISKSEAGRSKAAPSKPSLVSKKTADTVPEDREEVLSEVVVVGSSTQSKKSATTHFTEPDRPAPMPAEGWEAYRAYLDKNTDSSAVAGQVVVTFVVSSTGTLSGFTAKGPEELQKEAIRIISSGPAWIPTRKKGTAVASLAEIQLQFRQSQ